MGLKLTYTNKMLPKDEEVDIGGVLVVNGTSKTLTEEEERTLVTRVGMPARDYFQDSEYIKVEGSAEIKPSEVAKLTEGGEE